MQNKDYDIAIIGGGPGGYVSAIKAAQLGTSVVLIEKESLGGTCLNRGCIPTKTLLAATDKLKEVKKLSRYGISASIDNIDFAKLVKRKDIVVKKLNKGIENILNSYENIELISGKAIVNDEHSLTVNEQLISFKNLIIATGSTPSSIPEIEPDGEFILNSNHILEQTSQPESLLIVGSGAIGIEWARIFSTLGTKTSIIELADNLSPASDKCVSEFLEKSFKKEKITAYTSTSIEQIIEKTVYLSNGEIIQPEKILIAAGRKPCLIGLESLPLELNNKFIRVDKNFRTNIDNVYAIGDVNGEMQLAHVASHQGICAVEKIVKDKNSHMDYDHIPFIIYGNPEIASIGSRNYVDTKASIMPIATLGKAIADENTDGFIKIIEENGFIQGATIISKEASSLIHILALAMKEQIPTTRLKEFITAHPTYAEGLSEAILELNSESLSLPKSEEKR